MLEDTKTNAECAQTAIEELLIRLDDIYRNYIEKSSSHEKSFRGMSRLFKRWFSSYNPGVTEPVHQEFLEGVTDITGHLTLLLGRLSQEDPAMCNVYAVRAAECILAPKKPDSKKAAADWNMTIAEYQFAPLLPYLAWQDLKRIRDAQLKSTPRGMMLPKQREMLQTMENLLQKKQPDA